MVGGLDWIGSAYSHDIMKCIPGLTSADENTEKPHMGSHGSHE